MLPAINFIQMSLHIVSDESDHVCTEIIFSFNDMQLVSFSSIPLSGVTCWLNKWSSKKGLALGLPVAIIDIHLRENIIAYKRYETVRGWHKFDVSIAKFIHLLESMKKSIWWDMDVTNLKLMDLLMKNDAITLKMVMGMLCEIKPVSQKQTSLWQD